MWNEVGGALLGTFGAVLQWWMTEKNLEGQHRRELDMINADITMMRAEIEAAPKDMGSTGGTGSGTAWDRVIGNAKVPVWVTALRGSWRMVLSGLTIGTVAFGFIYLLRLPGPYSVVQAAVLQDFAGMLQFLSLLAFTFFFGTAVAKRPRS